MAAPLLEPVPVVLRPAPDSRVPALPWRPGPDREEPARPEQPPLPLAGEVSPDPAAPHVWSNGDVGPEVEQWAARLSVALFEALHGQRPVGQLTRWADERVLAELTYRRRQAGAARHSARPAMLRSLRVQHPVPEAAEVAAHLGWHDRSFALAFRLEMWSDRWLCVALECG